MMNEKEGNRKRGWFKRSKCGRVRRFLRRRKKLGHNTFRKSTKTVNVLQKLKLKKKKEYQKVFFLNMAKSRPHILNMYTITRDSCTQYKIGENHKHCWSQNILLLCIHYQSLCKPTGFHLTRNIDVADKASLMSPLTATQLFF